MGGKLIITKTDWRNPGESIRIFSGMYSDKGFYQVGFSKCNSEPGYTGQVGDIVVGRVRDMVKNINAAFVELQPGYTGYYSLEENNSHIFLNSKTTGRLCQGDWILVQIKKAAVKMKAPVLTSKISLSGQNAVLNINDNGIGFSGKIQNTSFRSEISSLIRAENEFVNYGIIIRTNAENADSETILQEIRNLKNEWEQIRQEAVHRPCYYTVRRAEPEYLRFIKGSYSGEIHEILTDNHEIYEEIRQYLHRMSMNEIPLTFYQDDLLPLYKLYNLESVIKTVLSRNVWLKSGAYLVIEPTEAMVVIDVNTGKCIKGRKQEDTIFKVNMEAAAEIAAQLRLRNLSGIIIIDFINMDSEDKKQELIEELKRQIYKDKIKTSFVEMTKLDLVVLTRKKTEAPVYEQLGN
ncbi:MAG: ribonuclease E/G [Lachnospiraceae bacterium]|nr:ribonuclease E/G [Lachnospiraceae bacterium]